MNTVQERTNEISPLAAAAFHEVAPRYLTVAQFSERNPAFSEAALRNLIFKAEARESTLGTIPGNGLLEKKAIVRLGRKVLIHEERFFAWVDSQGTGI